MTIARLLVILVASLGIASGAQEPGAPKTIPELQRAIEAVLKETKAPGAGIAIVSKDKVEWVAGVGLADVAANKPATADTLFRIGSTSKAFAALSALKLQEEGKLKLSDTVKQWAPGVAFNNPWESNNPVRLVHLMEHTTGFDDIHLREYSLNDPTPISLKDALAFGADSRVSRWPPGTRMSYCNSGPAVLAAVVEKVSGERFEDYVQENFFKPLHMDTASYFYTPEVQKRLAKLYRSDGVTEFPYWHICFRPAGSINASPKDMANYVRFYLQRGGLDGTQLVQASSIERMERTETLPAAKLGNISWYGLYNYASCEDAFVFHGHNGAVDGGLTEMAYLPEQGRGYVVMMNWANWKAFRRVADLVRHYVIRGLTPPQLPPIAKVPADVQEHYSGYYEETSPRSQWLYGVERLLNVARLKFTDDGLAVVRFDFRQENWKPVTDRLFRREKESAATLALLPDADGEVTIQSDWCTFKKVPALMVWAQRAGAVGAFLMMLSSPVFGVIRGVWRLFGKFKNLGPRRVRMLPLLSSLTWFALVGVFCFELQDLPMLGVVSPVTVLIFLLTIAFPITAAASVYFVCRDRRTPMNRFIYWHSVLVAISVAGVAIYMGCWGFVGLRLWA